MRSGRLLAEESPANLLAQYHCKNLEDVFLQLSRKQGTTNAVHELNISNLSLSNALAFGNKKDAPVYISQDSGVVGLNFHQSKEVLINDHNGSAMGVSDIDTIERLFFALIILHVIISYDQKHKIAVTFSSFNVFNSHILQKRKPDEHFISQEAESYSHNVTACQ